MGQFTAQQNLVSMGINSAADLSEAEGLIVAIDASGNAALTTAADDEAFGVVVRNAPSSAAGTATEVAVGGIVRVKCSAAIAIGDLVIAGADGKAEKATDTLCKNPIGICVVASGGNNQYAMVYLFGKKMERPSVQETRYFVAAADLRTKQYYAVKVDTDSKVNVCNAAGEHFIGILQNAPNTGAIAIVRTYGLSKAVLGATLSAKGALLKTTDTGKMDQATEITANTGTGAITGSYVGAILLETGVDTDVKDVFVKPIGVTHTYA